VPVGVEVLAGIHHVMTDKIESWADLAVPFFLLVPTGSGSLAVVDWGRCMMEEGVHTYAEMMRRLRQRLGAWSEYFLDEDLELRRHLQMAVDLINVGMSYSEYFDPPFAEKWTEGFFYPFEEGEDEWMELLLWHATAFAIVMLEINSEDEDELEALQMFHRTIDKAQERAWDAFFGHGDDGDDPDGEDAFPYEERAA